MEKNPKKFGLFILVSLLLGAIWFPITQVSQESEFSDEIIHNDPYIVNFSREFDKNNNKISDSLEAKVAGIQDGYVETIVGFNHAPTLEDQIILENLGSEWITSFNIIYAAHVSIPISMLETVAELYTVSSISENARSSSNLLMSSKQIRARGSAWNYQFNDINITGMEYFSTAVLDTGVDDSHPDLSSRLIAWVDFSGADSDVSGDNYTEYSDFGHHGTHVAGIISGQGNSSKNGYLNVSQAGIIQHNQNHINYGPAFLKTDSSSSDVIIRQSWNENFDSWVGIAKDGADITTLSSLTGNNSEVSFTINTPGNYTAFVGGNDQANINYDISYVAQTAIPVEIPSDGYGAATGIAPNSKIVGVKVLDDHGAGTSAQLLQGYDWCVENKDEYNITVINLSLGFGDIISAIDTATTNLVNDHGFIVVVSAGNDGISSSKIGSPGSTPEAITVGAVNRLNEVAYYSSIGNSIDNNIVVKPDITAPGGSYRFQPHSSSQYGHLIFAPDSNFDDEYGGVLGADGWIDSKSEQDRYPDDYVGMQGTSMAAPHISGLAQLLIQRIALENGGEWVWSKENAQKIKQILCMATSESANLGLGGEDDQTPTLDRGVKDYTEGWGRVDATAALDLIDVVDANSFEKELTFSSKPDGIRIAAYKIYLTAGVEYNFRLNILDSNSDIDLFLYKNETTDYGEPIEVAKENSIGLGVDQIMDYTPIETGYYYIVARWADGEGESNVILTAATLNDALDNYDLSFVTGGANDWFFQTAISHDGIDSAQSGAISHDETSWITTTLQGPGILSFRWKVSSQQNYDNLTLYVNDVEIDSISGEIDWELVEYNATTAQEYYIKWEYAKDSSVDEGNDCGWLDMVEYELTLPSAPILNEIDGISTSGNVYLSWNSVPDAYSYKIYRDDSFISDLNDLIPIAANITDTSYTDTMYVNGTYYYVVVSTNLAGDSEISNCENVTVEFTFPLPEAPILQEIENPSTSGEIFLNWSSVMFAESYKIYRSLEFINSIEGMNPIAFGITQTNYTDTIQTNGTYYYVIVATNTVGDSDISNCEQVTVEITQEKTLLSLNHLIILIGSLSLCIIILYKVITSEG